MSDTQKVYVLIRTDGDYDSATDVICGAYESEEAANHGRAEIESAEEWVKNARTEPSPNRRRIRRSRENVYTRKYRIEWFALNETLLCWIVRKNGDGGVAELLVAVGDHLTDERRERTYEGRARTLELAEQRASNAIDEAKKSPLPA